MTYRTFTCARCGGAFRTLTTEAERDAESVALYSGTMDEETASTCDACFLQVCQAIAADPARVEADRAQELAAKMLRDRK